jgi:hypothetical protein
MLLKLNLLPRVEHFEKLKLLYGYNLWGIIAESLMFHHYKYFSRKIVTKRIKASNFIMKLISNTYII